MVWEGRPRTGKTYSLIHNVITKDLNKGRKVYSNIPINWQGYEQGMYLEEFLEPHEEKFFDKHTHEWEYEITLRVRYGQWKKRWWRKFLEFLGKKNWKSYPKTNLRYWNKLSDLYDLRKGVIVIDELPVYMNSRKWETMPEEFQLKLQQHGKDRIDIKATVQHFKRVDVVFRELIDYWYVMQKGLFGLWFIRWEFNIEQDQAKKNPLSRRWVPANRYWKTRYGSFRKIVEGSTSDEIFTLEKGF